MDTTPKPKNWRHRPLPDLTAKQLRDKATWTVDDIRVYFSISRDTLAAWRRDDPTFPPPKVMPGGRVLRWDTDAVLAWFHGLEVAA